LVFGPLANPLIARIPKDISLMPVQELVRLGDIRDVSGRCFQAMDNARVSIDANVHFEPKMPCLALPGLMHLGVALPVTVLGRRGGFDDRRIHNTAFLEQQRWVLIAAKMRWVN